MSQPIDVDLPHNLGKDEARRRIANNIHKLEEHIPGGAQVQSGWAGDQLNLDIAAMGQSVIATIDVMETNVHLRVLLPGMLGMFAGLIQGALQKKGNVLLEDHRRLSTAPAAKLREEGGMRHFAVIGSGPAGFYTAEALEKAYGEVARIDILDRYPVPYGLIRFGVAPDHQSLKAVSKRYDKVVESAGVDFIGNVTVGRDVSVDELLELYDAVILAIGAPHDRKLGIPGEDLPGVVGSAEFVGWYNGHPDFADLDPPLSGTHAAVIGNGNVALDCARILSKTRGEFEGSDIVGHALDALDASAIKTVTILGRRGPHQISMTPKELGELGHLEATLPIVDLSDFPPREADEALEPGQRKSVTILREFNDIRANKPKSMIFDFFARPVPLKATGKPSASSSSAPSLTTRAGHAAPARPTKSGPRWWSAASAIRRRRWTESPMTSEAANFSTRADASPNAFMRSAGRGGDRAGRSAPTARMAMRSPI